MTDFITLIRKKFPLTIKDEYIIQKIGLYSIGISLVIIALTMSVFVMYTKQKLQKDLIFDGFALTNMIASYSVDELKRDNANKLLDIVNYTGNKSGLIYSIIMDINKKVIAHTGSSYADSTLIAQRAATSNNPLQQIYEDKRTNHTIYEFSRPIYNNGQKEGFVRLGFSPDVNPIFSDSDVRGILLVATLFFSMVPIFYYLVRSSLRLHTLLITDELTGLYNRRGFFRLAKDFLTVAKRENKAMNLLYADLDNLKVINDTLGHEEGDRLIKDTADILKSTYRTSDIIARIGGDEFVVLPAGNNEDHIAIIADRLKRNVEEFNVSNGKKYRLEISAGISKYDPNSMQSIDELLAQADDEMYKDKQSKSLVHKRRWSHARTALVQDNKT